MDSRPLADAALRHRNTTVRPILVLIELLILAIIAVNGPSRCPKRYHGQMLKSRNMETEDFIWKLFNIL
jgi:hypothetical protein